MRRIELAVLTTLGLALAGCATDTGLGNAVRQNMAAQVIDPDPTYRGLPIEAGSGDRAALALRRYREGRVLDPRPSDSAAAFDAPRQQGGNAGAGAAAPPR